VVQIVHCGIQSKAENNGGLEIIGPSPGRDKDGNQVGRAMTVPEIDRIVDDFGAAAERARDAGFDGVQLHYAHGYLGSQFLSPFYNRRDDDYGGSLENRCRFLSRVYLRVRQAVGEDFPLMAKLNVEDFIEGGLCLADGIKAAVMLKDLGVDALEVSGGSGDSGRLGPARRIKEEKDEAYFKNNAVAVKDATGLPVMLVGGLKTPGLIAEKQKETGLDFYSMSRPLIREPDLINRWSRGDLSRARCTSCNGCFLSIKLGRGVFCVKTLKEKKSS